MAHGFHAEIKAQRQYMKNLLRSALLNLTAKMHLNLKIILIIIIQQSQSLKFCLCDTNGWHKLKRTV